MNNLVKRRFTKAIRHYDDNAIAQRVISDKLFSYISNTGITGNIIEFGCGTGNLSAHLAKLNPNKLLLNDICEEYVQIISDKLGTTSNENISFLCGNAEEVIKEIIEKEVKFNLITSSSAIQWLNNPIQFLINCKKALAPKGVLAISTFANDNLREVKAISGCGLNYNTENEIRELLEPYYNITELITKEIILTFNTPIEVLKHLKLTGVNGTNDKSWTKGDLEQFTKLYHNNFRTSTGLYTLTYTPIYLICTNNDN